jgi:hypothetical protein
LIKQKIFICFFSIVFILLYACTNKDNLPIEEKQIELAEEINNVLVDENPMNRKDELVKLIKKVPYPDEPQQVIFELLKQTESFLELEKYSDELLDYALDLLQDETLTYNEKWVFAYVLLGVDFEKYKYLLRDVAVLFVEEKINRRIAGFLFFPGEPGLGIRNHEDPVIIEALEIYIKSDKVDARTKASIIKNRLKREDN